MLCRVCWGGGGLAQDLSKLSKLDNALGKEPTPPLLVCEMCISRTHTVVEIMLKLENLSVQHLALGCGGWILSVIL